MRVECPFKLIMRTNKDRSQIERSLTYPEKYFILWLSIEEANLGETLLITTIEG